MIITTVKNDKLFIQFDRVVKQGKIRLTGDKGFELEKDISDTDFEVVGIPDDVGSLYIAIYFDDESITRIINTK